MRLPRRAALISAVCFISASLLPAQTLNFDINNGTANNYAGVGIVPGDTGTTWNALGLNGTQTSASIFAGDVKSSVGATLAGVSVTIAHGDGTSAIKRYSTTGNSVPNPVALMQDYAYGATFNVTVSGLTPGTYGLWFFGHGDVNSQTGTVTVASANGGGTGSTANSALGRDLINGGSGVSFVRFTNLVVGTDGAFAFQAANYFNGFQLSRTPGPAITAQPPPTPSVVIGGDATLSVSAAGDGAITYRWQKAGVDLSDGPTGHGSTFSGASTASLTIQSAQLADAGDYRVVVTSSGVSVTSGTAGLSVVSSDLPEFTSSPLSQTLSVGDAITLAASATSPGTLAYQWQKSTNGGGSFADLPGATSATYTLPVGRMSAAGQYRLVATNAAGSATSSAATITVIPAYAPLVPDGFAESVTGGGNLTPVVVTTVAAFKALAEGTSPAVITVSGTLNLAGNVRVKSNKTIQGIDADATIIGNVLLRDVSNVILRGLNFTHPGSIIGADGKYTDGGDGVSVDTSTRVLVTHCTFIDCADGMIDTRLGSTDVTLSWCKLSYTSTSVVHRFTMIADGNVLRDPVTDAVTGPGVPLRMTFHHNWWAENCDQRMPSSTNARAHLFNNYWNTPGNFYAALARSGTEFLSEQNRYVSVNSPLSKSVTEAALAAPLIRAIGNSYASCTGTIDAGTGIVFTPPYSYPLRPVANVADIVTAHAGNTAGAASSHPAPVGAATITGPALVGFGGSATLVVSPTGIAPLSYQWRFKNMNVAGANSSSLQITSAQTSHAGDYSVVLGLSDGASVVSAGFTLSVVAPFPAYVANHGLDPATDGTPEADPDGDGISNLLEFAFGLDPLSATVPTIETNGSTLLSTGAPTLRAESDTFLFARFVRLKSTASGGLVYTPQFSADLATWQDDLTPPTVIASDAEYELVELAFPPFLDPSTRKFFRVRVSQP